MKTLCFLSLIFLLVQNVIGIIFISPTFPGVYERATISCYSNETSRTWVHKELLLSICNKQRCLPNEILQSGYTFTADNDKTEVAISSLNRIRDGGLWVCSAGVNQSIFLDIYSFPSGVSITQGGTTEVDLAESQTILHCQTDGCTFTAPTIRWYFKDIVPSAPRTLYKDTRTQVTGGNCTSPEELYTSSLVLPLYTIWQGNIDKNVTLFCGIEYSNVSRNVYSQESKQIRYAVRVTDAVIQQNNQNITDILNVTAGVPVTLTCSTGTSRPPATIVWYLGSQSKGNGAIWNFTPIAADHNGTFYCQVYNTDQNQTIVSNKARLYVRVPIDSVQLRNSTILTLNEGQLAVLICETDACRPSADIYWMKNGIDIMDSPTGVTEINVGNDLFVSMGMLNYTGQRGDNGKRLTCGAYNGLGIGQTSGSLTVTIYYTAKITEFVAKGNVSEILENSTLELYCRVDSNPYSVISLSFGDVLISRIRNAHELIHNTTAGCLNAGIYICSATNSVMNGVIMSADVNLKILCRPRLDYRKNVSTEYYRALNDNVTLEVNIIGYPEPTDIMWYHRGAKTDIWQQVLNQPISSSGLFSSITVHLDNQVDFGDYLVNMTNSFGIYDLIFHVIPESLPGVPTEFSVSQRRYDSVTLEWIPGFWGGHTQYFVIQYRIYPDGNWIDTDQIQEDSKEQKQSFIVNDLQQKTTYEFQMFARNKIGQSKTTQVINTTTSVPSTSESVGLPVTGIAGGISAGLVGILIVVIGIFLWRRYQWKKRNEHDNDITREHEERDRIKDSSVKQDAGSGKEYEGLHFTEAEANQYLQLNGITLEENRITNASLRSQKAIHMKNCTPMQTTTSRCIAH